MPSPQIIAREPGRRVKKSPKPERREKAPVDTGDVDMESATPAHQSAKAGPGAGGGRERSRRINERVPKAAGAKAHEKSHATGMMDKGIGKKLAEQAKQRTSGRRSEGALSERPLTKKQPRRQGAKKQSRASAAKADGAGTRAAPAPEAAPTQKQVLRDKPAPRRRTVRDEGVNGGK